MLYLGPFLIRVNSPLNTSGCRSGQYSTNLKHININVSLFLSFCAQYYPQSLYRLLYTEGTYLNELLVEEMNRVSVVVSNPAYVAEAALDVDEVDPTDLAPLVSGTTSIVTAPA